MPMCLLHVLEKTWEGDKERQGTGYYSLGDAPQQFHSTEILHLDRDSPGSETVLEISQNAKLSLDESLGRHGNNLFSTATNRSD